VYTDPIEAPGAAAPYLGQSVVLVLDPVLQPDRSAPYFRPFTVPNPRHQCTFSALCWWRWRDSIRVQQSICDPLNRPRSVLQEGLELISFIVKHSSDYFLSLLIHIYVLSVYDFTFYCLSLYCLSLHCVPFFVLCLSLYCCTVFVIV
jgi:hypothetical protein